jgi:hypothetical protein
MRGRKKSVEREARHPMKRTSREEEHHDHHHEKLFPRKPLVSDILKCWAL